MTDIQNLCLGKKLGVVHDRRTLKASTILEPKRVNVPKTHRIAKGLTNVPMYGNDRAGDCTVASQAHRVDTQERSSSQNEIKLTTQQVFRAYQDVSGWDGVPGSPSDQGAYELDVLNYMRHVGLGLEKDGTPHTIYAFAAVQWQDIDQFKLAHYVFGGLKICAGLPLTAADQMDRGEAWDVVPSSWRANWGTWGGHSMYSRGFNDQGVWVWTWGREQFMTWRWIYAYVDECYCVISEDYVRRGGTTPQGLNVEALNGYLQSLR